jgi:hypothetical protein
VPAPKVKLSGQQLAALHKKSPQAVVDAAASLRRYLAKDRWIGGHNRYLVRPLEAIKQDVKPPVSANSKHLREYIAASMVLHAGEGWSYLGRALLAQAAGNADIARHLGYYAELRAAMAILATQGVGVFNGDHAVLDSAGDIHFARGQPTHSMAWLALSEWADSPVGTSRLAGLLEPQGLEIGEWVAAFGAGPSWAAVGQAWLRAWGLDLRRFVQDRLARNEASYRPAVRDMPALAPRERAAYLSEFWTMFEPQTAAPFQRLDLHLLRNSLDAAFKASTAPGSRSPVAFEERVAQTLTTLTLPDLGSPLGQFLTRQADPVDSVIVSYAGLRSTPLNPCHHLHVLSRAALLLRVASGLVAGVLRDAAVSFEELAFWYGPMVSALGLSPDAQPTEPDELWADVHDALEDVSATAADASCWDLHQQSGPALAVLGGCERIGMWALA